MRCTEPPGGVFSALRTHIRAFVRPSPRWRKRRCACWRKDLQIYLRHLKAVRESGCENAYNHYVVLYGDQPAFKRWVALHPIEWQRFADWFDSYNPADGECAYF